MIERGEKKEEYREIKPYWQERLLRCYQPYMFGIDSRCVNRGRYECTDCIFAPKQPAVLFDTVRFSYGYASRSMTFEVKSIKIGRGRPEWGAPDYDVFIIKLGKRL